MLKQFDVIIAILSIQDGVFLNSY